MKRTRIITLILAVIAVNSCNFLDFDESTGKSEEFMYSYIEETTKLVNHLYGGLTNDFSTIGSAMREASTDNLISVKPDANINDYFNGTWSELHTLDDVWGKNYKYIRSANEFLAHFNIKDFERFRLDPSFKEKMEMLQFLPGQARFLRAYYYFELAKRYRNVPLVTDAVGLDEVNELKPVSFETVIRFIVDECDAAAKELPVTYNGYLNNETGRVTKGACMALKSRALLYLASPLFNEGQEVEKKYQEAAKASMDLIKFAESGVYSIKSGEKLFGIANDALLTSQLIFEARSGSSSAYESANSPIAYEGAGVGKANCPTQNLMEAFRMADGTKFPSYAEGDVMTDPYEGRDPRFAETIMYNGVRWLGETVDIFKGGKNGQDKEYASRTGYYVMKHMNPGTSLLPGQKIAYHHHHYIFRYAEILLNYAEAMSESYGHEYKDDFFTMSAVEAVNKVRSRVSMPALASGLSPEEFKAELRNERRVELACEDHYFWDIRRWKIYGDAPADIDIYGVDVVKNGDVVTYKKKFVETHHWDPKMYFYPISLNELKKNPHLIQNPGWGGM